MLPRLTLPLAPLIRPGETSPTVSKRLRPEDVLDLEEARRQLAPSVLATLDIGGRPWSVIAVYSPYSPDMHVMVMETSLDRVLPGPEAVPPEEGDALMALWRFILDFISGRPGNASVYVGYNWSPRAWGEREERGGFQSIPTKWHAMLWGWPVLPPEGENVGAVDWVAREDLIKPARRVFGENAYAEPLSRWMAERLARVLSDQEGWHSGWKAGSMGLELSIARPLDALLAGPDFFSRVVGPTAHALDGLFAELSEALTAMRCADVDAEVVRMVREGKTPEGLRRLRKAPAARPRDEALDRFSRIGGPEPLFEPLYEAARRRAAESEPDADWWRKGFGYAWSLCGETGADCCRCRLLPGVYVGPGGVVEAQGVLLKRPLDRQLDGETLRRQSEALWMLAGALKQAFPTVSL